MFTATIVISIASMLITLSTFVLLYKTRWKKNKNS